MAAAATPPPNPVPVAYQAFTSAAPDRLNKGDNAWQMVSATLVGLQSVPGLVILYGSVVKKKWAVNSAFMALYAFAAVVLCWVTWAYKMSFGDKLLPFWGRAPAVLAESGYSNTRRLVEGRPHRIWRELDPIRLGEGLKARVRTRTRTRARGGSPGS